MSGTVDRNREECTAYYQWLMKYFEIDDAEFDQYGGLFWQLFTTEFRCVIEKDTNRVAYGLDLRDEYERETGKKVGNYIWSCSVLEVLMGLAKTIAESILGDPNDENLKKGWLFTWLNNLDLLKGVDKNGRYDTRWVQLCLDVWMNRDFASNGLGSPFPLMHPPCDQRKAEIWQQVMLYLAENVPEDDA